MMLVEMLRSRYITVMGTEGLNLADTTARFILRHWDGMDGCWTDCTGEVDAEQALREWWTSTDGATRQTSFDDIDYYRIFPANTRMRWDGTEGREMFRGG